MPAGRYSHRAKRARLIPSAEKSGGSSVSPSSVVTGSALDAPPASAGWPRSTGGRGRMSRACRAAAAKVAASTSSARFRLGIRRPRHSGLGLSHHISSRGGAGASRQGAAASSCHRSKSFCVACWVLIEGCHSRGASATSSWSVGCPSSSGLAPSPAPPGPVCPHLAQVSEEEEVRVGHNLGAGPFSWTPLRAMAGSRGRRPVRPLLLCFQRDVRARLLDRLRMLLCPYRDAPANITPLHHGRPV